jgi:hypothetical protein
MLTHVLTIPFKVDNNHPLQRILEYLAGTFLFGISFLEMTIIFLLLPTTMWILQWTWMIDALTPDLFYLLITVLFFGLLANNLVVLVAPLRQSTVEPV